jgi:hypothetical protein
VPFAQLGSIKAKCETSPVSYELRIVRTGQDRGEPINRHRWLSYALQTPALHRWDDRAWYIRQADEPLDAPVFGLRATDGSATAPRLFWLDGRIIVRDANDEWLTDLRSIASQLQGRLVLPDGGAA